MIAYKVRDFFSIVKHGVFIADKLHIERYGVGYGVVVLDNEYPVFHLSAPLHKMYDIIVP